MAMETEEAPHPYFAMVGNYGKPTWADTAVSYLSFYHRLAKGATIPDGVVAMKAASGDDGWMCQSADEIKQGYIQFVQASVRPEVAQRDLEVAAEQADVPETAKALEPREGV